jgi:Uma2 family endonuclease
MPETLEAPETKRRDASGRRWDTWDDVLHDPLLRDLPFKIETNQHGQVVMSPPAAPSHGGRQYRIGRFLEEAFTGGTVVMECPVKTTKGTKAPDAVWFSTERWEQARQETQSPVAPEICVEILSPSNTEAEMDEKRALYFEAGAEEVWLCSTEGAMRFFDADGEQTTSQRAPDFPDQIDV